MTGDPRSAPAVAVGPRARRDWGAEARGVVVRLVAIVFVLVAGITARRPVLGVLAAGGAFSAGFGAPRTLRGSHTRLLLVVSAGMAASAWVGTLAGRTYPTTLSLAIACGLGCGWAASRGSARSWIALQCAIASLIATSYPSTAAAGLRRAVPIGAGALLQALVLTAASLPLRASPGPEPTGPAVASRPVRLAIALAVSVIAEHGLPLRNGYWVPMTTLLVLRGEGRQTLARAVGRTMGTLVGAGVATSIALVFRPSAPVLIVLVAVSALGAYALLSTSYGVYAAALTAYIAFLLALVGLPEPEVAEARLVSTAVGGAIALSVDLASTAYLTFRSRRRRPLGADGRR